MNGQAGQATLDISDHSTRSNLASVGRIARTWVMRLAVGLLVLMLVGTAVVQGLELRQWLWESTRPIRFQHDVRNGFTQGLGVVLDARQSLPQEQRDIGPVPVGAFFKAYVGRYERYLQEPRRQGNLDYPPVRLLIMSLWVRHIRGEADPTAAQWREGFTAPMLRFNAMLELLAAIGMFVLVYHWLSRGRVVRFFEPEAHPSWRSIIREAWAQHHPWILGLLAAGLLWFNPAVMWNAHAWPQWDSWIIPFYIWAAVLASIGWWFGAGLLLAAGCMFKGQLLLAAPVLVLWPLFAGQIGAAARVLLGFGFGAVIITSPWLMQQARAWAWLGGVAASAGLLVCFLRHRRFDWRFRTAAAAVLLICLAWPWVMVKEWKWFAVMVLAAATAAAHPLLLRRMPLRHVAAGVVMIGIILAAVRFDASMDWYRLGFARGTEQYQHMAITVNNLPAIMEKHGWGIQDPVGLGWAGLPRLGLPGEMPVQKLLRAVYLVLLVLCAVGLAVQSRRNSPRMLIALAAPWLLFFAVLPQMHERYLLWAAALSAAGVAVGWRLGIGMFLMYLVISGVSLGQMAEVMLRRDPTFAPAWLDFLHRSRPDLGWVILFAAGVYLYLSLVPGRANGTTKIQRNEGAHRRPALAQ
jgi:hypothetical protein